MKKKYIIIIPLLLTALCGCATNTNNNTNDIAETKTYLYNYDYETDSNGEVHTDYHEEKPSVNLNESHEEVEPTVNFKKGAVTYVKMNETYNSGACECTVLKAYSTVSKQFCADTFGEEYFKMLANCYCVVIPLKDKKISSGQLVLLQAMQFKKPIIITDTVTVKTYVKNLCHEGKILIYFMVF